MHGSIGKQVAKEFPKVLNKLQKFIIKEVVKEPPKVVGKQVPKAPPQKKSNTKKLGIYYVPNNEIHKLTKIIQSRVRHKWVRSLPKGQNNPKL